MNEDMIKRTKENIKDILFEIFKRADMSDEKENFCSNVHINIECSEENNIIDISIYIEMENIGRFDIKITGGKKDYLRCVSEQEQTGAQYLSYCLLDAFCELFQSNFFIYHITSDAIAECAYEIYYNACRTLYDRIKRDFQIDIEIIQYISSLPYEGEACQGWIFFSFSSNIEMLFSLLDKKDNRIPFKKEESRKIRKMLEMTKEQNMSEEPVTLVFVYNKSRKNWVMHGVAKMDMIDSDGIGIHFISHMVWRMVWRGKIIMNYRNGFLEFPMQQEQRQFKDKVKALIKGISCEKNNNLWEVVNAARKQKHGTILVIFFDKDRAVNNEVERLLKVSSGNPLEKPKDLNENVLLSITAIDGAVIMDASGKVYGYGFILDGSAEVEGDAARGARYNSARRYIVSKAWEGKKAIAVIISEDGMINFYSTEDKWGEKNGKN